jgi:hypothetical protein
MQAKLPAWWQSVDIDEWLLNMPLLLRAIQKKKVFKVSRSGVASGSAILTLNLIVLALGIWIQKILILFPANTEPVINIVGSTCMYTLGRWRSWSCDELSTICSQVVVHGDIDGRNRIGGDVRE